MHRSQRIAMRPESIEGLEARWLLSMTAAATIGQGWPDSIVVPGNTGTIRRSQFVPAIPRAAEWEQRSVVIHGPLKIHVVTPYQAPGTSDDGLSTESGPPTGPPANTGLISNSQFANGGFLQFGAQLQGIQVGRGLTIDDYDETAGQPNPGGGPPPNVVSSANTGAVIKTQFNDGGFGKIGVQLRAVHIRGGLTIQEQLLLRNPDGSPLPAPTPGQTISLPTSNSPVPIEHSVNSNLLVNDQVNDGGFGDVGLQWQDVRVKGSVSIGAESYTIQPLPTSSQSVSSLSNASTGSSGSTQVIYGSPTNTGWIRDTQFNDGGFGDIGYQWWNVSVGGQVGISDDNLSIQPEQNGVGPITVTGLNFNQPLPVSSPTTTSSGTATAAASVSSSADDNLIGSPAVARATPAVSRAGAPDKNEATNSGRIMRTQFNDGGFGDDGLQWMAVKVDGSVSTVHNSLSVQPENVGQGLITVSNIQFPAAPTPAAPAPRGPRRVLEPSPAIIDQGGGGRPARLVSRPTRPVFDRAVKNEATNSGVIGHSQFNDGGFGDIGMQWHDVHVMGNVQLVHNSLSVQPQGAGFAGTTISNVSFGNPFTPAPPSAHQIGFAVLPSLVYTPPPQPNQNGGNANQNGSNANRQGGSNGSPPNNRVLDHQQYLTSTQADVVLQWDGVHPRKQLVIIHNVIQIRSTGPTTGPVILNNIRFPGQVPPINATSSSTTAGAAAQVAGGSPARDRKASATSAAIKPTVVNAATNSGALKQNQFAAGGFGDIGLQWRDVKVHGSVSVVHNSLSVNATGTANGPITVANVTFNSGVFDRPTQLLRTRLIVSPPPTVSRLPQYRPIRGRVLHQNPRVLDASVNSGILAGGQYGSGGLGHIMLQWRKVGISGPVKIIDNVLSVKTSGPSTSPVTIDNVTFG